ncbi:MAG: pyridoxine 5'-phosphate synthase [Proteobacteria bacterium]|nr:pyridoxine 5'-phosphate synthase [Pseudomonadota bacterium]
MIRLGVNIDHVATLRNARGDVHPDPLRAALLCQKAGADVITAHLREDRRHIRDSDMERLKNESPLPLNMEMALTEEMLGIALRLKPHAACIVPERRQELTTEGGLDAKAGGARLAEGVKRLQDAGVIVALFISPDPAQVEAAKASGAKAIEFHTGAYAHARGAKLNDEIKRLQDGARLAAKLGLEVHAGHGLNDDNVAAVAAVPEICELNIGHFLMGAAVFVGLEEAVRRMKQLMVQARNK